MSVHPTSSSSLLLVSIPFSHYNVRAAWALQRAGLSGATKVTRCMPLLHLASVRARLWLEGLPARASERNSSPLGTPLLVIREAGLPVRALQQSADIVRFADGEGGRVFGRRQLSATEAAEEAAFVRDCEDDLGINVRTWAYSSVTYDFAQFLSLGVRNSAGPVSALLWVLLSPLTIFAIRRAFKLATRHVERRRGAESKLRAFFARASARLAGRRFFFGDSFGPGDLTFAALGFYAVGLSPQHLSTCVGPLAGAFAPPIEQQAPDLQAFAREMRATPAGQHLLRMVRDESGDAAVTK